MAECGHLFWPHFGQAVGPKHLTTLMMAILRHLVLTLSCVRLTPHIVIVVEFPRDDYLRADIKMMGADRSDPLLHPDDAPREAELHAQPGQASVPGLRHSRPTDPFTLTMSKPRD